MPWRQLTGGLTNQQLRRLISAHNAYLCWVIGTGRRPDGTCAQRLRCAQLQGCPQLMHILNATQFTRLGNVARMPDGSVVKQLFFAEGLAGLGSMVGRPRSKWRDRASADLRPVLTSRLAGWGWYGVAQACAQWRALCDSAQPAA
eukprot:77848-Chlamydomonas_euryale.AAC.1